MPKFSNGHGKVSEMKDLLYQFIQIARSNKKFEHA
jgi:hypothetical protein